MLSETGKIPVDAGFHTELIRCGLQDRVIGGLIDLSAQSWRIVYLQSGAARLTEGDSEIAIEAPALIWQPLKMDSQIRVRAGSVGAFLQLGDNSLTNAIGRKPEAAEIRMMTGMRVALPLESGGSDDADISRSFELIFREGRTTKPGAETIVEAQVRVLLVLLWRYASEVGHLLGTKAMSSHVVQRFRHQLEVHFRERLGVADYAKLLGTSSDRLHDICTRMLGRPPLRLIHERTLYEAQVLLERSTQTVDQIAAHLGFRSAGQFTKFFKSYMGVPPSSYRLSLRSDESGDRPVHEQPSLADWP